MDDPLIERRTGGRVSGLSLPIVQATLRPGTAVHIVDVGEAGMLVQTDRPLRPGGRTQVRLELTTRTICLAATVLRCVVWRIHPMAGISYRGALRFDIPCPRFWQELSVAAGRAADG